MEFDIHGTSTTSTREETMSDALGLESWEPFQPAEILDLHNFTYDSKANRIMQERVNKVLAVEGAPLSVVN
jgi:hypothetical protein